MSSIRKKILGMASRAAMIMVTIMFWLGSANLSFADQYIPLGTGNPTYSYNDIPFEIEGVWLYAKHAEGEFVPVETIDLSGYTANKIHIMELGTHATNIPNGVVLGKISVFYEDGTSESLDLITGVNTAEWAYDRPENQCCLAHAKLPPAFSYWTNHDSDFYYFAHNFYVSIDTKNKPLDYLELFLDPSSYTGQPSCPDSCEFYIPPDWSGIAISAITLQVKKVLLIHGIWSHDGVWEDAGVNQLLEENGYMTDPLKFCPNNDKIEAGGIKIAERLATILDKGPGSTVDIVAHSMGGLAARWYLAHPELWPGDGNGHGIRKLITLGTPHLGTDIHLLHPIAANYLEYWNRSKYGCNNFYDNDSDPPHNFNIWSPALREMTAIWKPTDEWRGREPMGFLERRLAMDMEPLDITPEEWQELSNLFPSGPRSRAECLRNHKDYYDHMIEELTGSQKLSPLLEELTNPIAFPSDVEYYLVAGTNPTLISQLNIMGDYGDGIVPLQSASGEGLPFPPSVVIKWIGSNHNELPNRAKKLIIQYLNE
ncbi:MAG: hypothetical protein ACFFCW_15250 [Candidatus Hodarchaeota archaeon]